jgi:hypothetical protein
VALAFWGALDAEAAVELRGFLKSSYPMTDAVITGVEPNVFFLLDVGSPMTFSPEGIMPLATDGRSLNARAVLLQDSTYGVGARPFMTSGARVRNVVAADGPSGSDIKKGDVLAQDIITGTEQTNINENAGYSRYGRETDFSNNFLGNPNTYYSPYDAKPYFLTFKNKTFAEWTNYPSTYPADFPAALKPYMTNGQSVPKALAEEHLVPNDSRMYMMRLVLWRLTDPANADLFRGINVAMGTSYQETNYGTTSIVADFYKTAASGATEGQNTYYGATGTFQWGNAPSWATGTGADGTGAGGNYYMSQTVFAGVMRDYYDYGSNTAQWRQVNRAVMKIPFGKFYRLKQNGDIVGTEKLLDFREYINGIEAVSGGTAGAVVDPEFTSDGQTPLSTSIYGRNYHTGNNDSIGKRLIQYAPFTGNYGSSSLILNTSTTLDGLPTGQAAGSAIDFFSPRSSGNTSDGLDFSNSTLGFFPVTGSCQSNWLVIFTAGNDESPGAHSAHEAALKLYKDTMTMRGREYKNGVWEEKTYAMDSGVRTLVVGFVDPEAMDTNSVHLRETLTQIAQYGDPVQSGGAYIPNPDAIPYFANDVPGLISNLTAVLKRINSDRMAVGAPVMVEGTGGGLGDAMFSASYTVKTMDQWGAWPTNIGKAPTI